MLVFGSDKLAQHRTWKNHLPSYFKLKCFHFDVSRLADDIESWGPSFTNVFAANKDLCGNHPYLTEMVKDHYEQVGLTIFNPSKAEPSQHKVKDTQKPDSYTSSYRQKISPRNDQPHLDERNYNLPTQEYANSYLHQCVSQISQDPMRVRLVKLRAGKEVGFHIDYDPSFAIRIFVPIITNQQVWNLTKRKGNIEKIHAPADGHPWFLNTGFAHSVVNHGQTDRTILMFSIKPNNLLHHISQAWKAGHEELLSIS
jgi:hypothetical protein